ncbi:glucan endo-1,3-beta-glucosidase, acidic isoform PR-N-like [Solanum tuberosum]|uniref:glucan endo-1,3-beta-glucosidase, acidic isoform PR-N-like n=1 Tax=Solanum tuberosum TaxID=4113 RepID=UPI0003D25072|nr:PREDICTED: glucan endo-1,3-beta-glucosidase, acidic isoform PR-N-like [Solanum tuberosum]
MVCDPTITSLFFDNAEVQCVGVCYGRNGNNLPLAEDVVNLYKSNGITSMRVYDPIPETLNALKDSNLQIMLCIPNDKLQALTDPKEAYNWVVANVINYIKQVRIRYISVGNEISPLIARSSQFVPFLLPAMENVQRVITSFRLNDRVKISTAIEMGLLANTYPPSQSTFRGDVTSFIKPIIEFLKQNNAPLLANIYPYFAYIGDPEHVSLSYAIFAQPEPDSSGYTNLFDAMLDSIYYAIGKVIGENKVEIVVSESGWPSEGGFGGSMGIATIYYRNLIGHAKSKAGTIHKPGKPIETYLFAMFDENLKIGAETERHFGVFHPDKTQKYNLTF